MRLHESLYEKTKKAFLSPAFLGAVALMVVNDHVLKPAGILPGLVTGKLSDVAFLFFAPIALAFLLRADTRRRLFVAYLLPALLFIAVNCVGAASDVLSTGMSLIIPTRLWPDTGDLVALSVMPLSFFYLRTRRTPPVTAPARGRRRFAELALASVVSLTCLATSPRPPETFEPVYMSWADLRAAVKVLPPEQIGKRGKICVKGDYLYVSEPNKGIHVIDLHNPEKPEARAFFRVPGNFDIAISGSALYADSFTDLLVFCVAQEPADSVLVKRVEDVFPYNPFQTLEENASVYYYSDIDRNKGVIIDWRQKDVDVRRIER
jgi:hypothetical protein